MSNPFVGGAYETHAEERRRLAKKDRPWTRVASGAFGLFSLGHIAYITATRPWVWEYAGIQGLMAVGVSIAFLDHATAPLQHKFMLWRFDRAARKARR